MVKYGFFGHFLDILGSPNQAGECWDMEFVLMGPGIKLVTHLETDRSGVLELDASWILEMEGGGVQELDGRWLSEADWNWVSDTDGSWVLGTDGTEVLE